MCSPGSVSQEGLSGVGRNMERAVKRIQGMEQLPSKGRLQRVRSFFLEMIHAEGEKE